jgi:hypothetical protein
MIEKYEQHRFFAACDTAGPQIDLAAIIGAHLGLNPGKNLTATVLRHFSAGPPSLLILDNLETIWEPTESREDIEEFLSLLTDVQHLGLIVSGIISLYAWLKQLQVTMRGAERPGKVQWTHPFLHPLQPLPHNAAHQTFIDIADDFHNSNDINNVLLLTDNIPLVIDLIASLVNSEGCAQVLSRWEEERTSLISEGPDRRSNLDLSIWLSLSSPRITALPHSQNLLGLLSILPDGLSDVELLQSNLPMNDPLACKVALLRTSLAYSDDRKRLKALVPIREYMRKSHPPEMHLTRPLLKYFQQLLEAARIQRGTAATRVTVSRIESNYANIQNMFLKGLNQYNPDVVDIIYHTLLFSRFSGLSCHRKLGLMDKIAALIHQIGDYKLHVLYISEMFNAQTEIAIENPEALIIKALANFPHFDDPDVKCNLPTLFFSSYSLEFHRFILRGGRKTLPNA